MGDKQFFTPGQGAGTVVQPFHHKYTEHGKELSGRKLKVMTALEKDIDPAELRINKKKHFKGNKRAAKKVRTVGDYDWARDIIIDSKVHAAMQEVALDTRRIE